MVGGGIAIWLLVTGLGIYSIIARGPHEPRTTQILVIGGGTLFPTVVLTTLLCFSLSLMPELHRPAPPGSLQIHVSGVRWWWRVGYRIGEHATVETANEIRLPVNEPVEFTLSSEDVVHSFWIPSLGGKVDMVPGRETRLKLHPTRVGTFRGVCAEYCGTAHAQMNFHVIVMERADFDQWLERQKQLADEPQSPKSILGRDLFHRKGCGGCHTIGGSEAIGRVGPDLTHVADRSSLGAGIFANDATNLRRWITHTGDIKPGVQMPAFETLSEQDIDAIVSYLETLK